MIDDQLGKIDKDKRVISKGQDLFGESIIIKIGPLRDQDLVWAGVRDWPVTGPEIQLLVAEAGWSETRLCSTLVNRGCVNVASVCCIYSSNDYS